MLLLCCMEERIVLEPVCLFLTECTIVRIIRALRAEGMECLFQDILLKRTDTIEIDKPRICLVGQEKFFLRQPAALRKWFGINEHKVARKGRDGLIRRIAASYRTEW